MNLRNLITAILLVSSLLQGGPSISCAERDSINLNSEKGGIINKLIRYFEKSNKHEITNRPHFTFIAGPHYSKESGFGLGLVLGGSYSTAPQDSLVPLSNISVVGDIATKNLYLAGIRGEHFFSDLNRRINYSLSVKSQSSYFWGIGYYWGLYDGNKVKYRALDVALKCSFEYRVFNRFFVGPVFDGMMFSAHNPQSKVNWQNEPLTHISVSAGGKISYDSRDNHTATKQGLHLELIQLFAPRFIGNGRYSFSSTELSANFFIPLWTGATLATRLHGAFTYGHTPWGKLPTLGDGTMRSYYEGRYRDKDCIDAVIEIRQKLIRRSGIVLWVGAGTVFPKFKDIRYRNILPECGMGYRWEFKRNSNVRIDYGIGRNSSGFVFSLNESF
ncbi:MAG: BamA/TamA family outer membrane protein [Duncaniella sp.]|nr:BamA/TamA family outer membrane protein [Duncaniella sp.]MDE6465643.1 BamA/TamA family outer membrane protein [Duncaniella sp.]